MQNWERNGWKVVTGCLKTLALTKDVKWWSCLKTNWIRIYEKIVLQRQPSVSCGGGWERSIPLSLSLKRRAKIGALACTPRSSGGTVESTWHTPKESKAKRLCCQTEVASGGRDQCGPDHCGSIPVYDSGEALALTDEREPACSLWEPDERGQSGAAR